MFDEGISLKMKLFGLCFLFFLIVSVTPVFGVGEGEWITNYRVEDLKTGQVYMEHDLVTGEITEFSSLFDGSELNVTITFNVAVTVSHVNLRISTNLAHSVIEDRYWQIHTKNYEFEDYNPNEKYLEFQQVRGTFTISCYGKVPIGITETNLDGYVLHRPVDFVLIKLNSPSGELLDNIEIEVLDAEIDEFRNLLEKRNDKLDTLKSTGVAPGYIELFESVLIQAEEQAELGFVEEAINLLDALAVEQEPVSSTTEALFLPIMAVLAVASVALGFLYVRARSKSSYVLSVIEDQIKDLEGLTLRVSKIDRSLSPRLESMKERLKKLIWT
jgi:hypothetical protein